MPTKKLNTTIQINKANFEGLKTFAEKKGFNTTIALNILLNNIGLSNNKVKPIVFQIPVELLEGRKEDLKLWLEAKSEAVLNLLYEGTN